MILGSSALLAVLFSIVYIVFKGEKRKNEEEDCKNFLICPIRGALQVKKYDIGGNYTEEYQRIRLIRYLIQKKKCPKSFFRFEYPLERSFGHQGHSKVRILVDLVLEKEGRI
nr:3135_t:CDS:1 [Entrophospora candida]